MVLHLLFESSLTHEQTSPTAAPQRRLSQHHHPCLMSYFGIWNRKHGWDCGPKAPEERDPSGLLNQAREC